MALIISFTFCMKTDRNLSNDLSTIHIILYTIQYTLGLLNLNYLSFKMSI